MKIRADRCVLPITALYLDESNGGYGLYNQDMEQFGICERPKDPQHLYCVLLMDEIDTYHAAECKYDRYVYYDAE